MSNVMKILSVGAELLHEDGQTDMTNLIVVLRSFVKDRKNFANEEETRRTTASFCSTHWA
jgi:hypothetical protein